MDSQPGRKPLTSFNLVRPQFFGFSESDTSSLPGLVDAGRRVASVRHKALAGWLAVWGIAAVAIVLASAKVELSLVLLEIAVLTLALVVTAFVGLHASRRGGEALDRYFLEMWRYNIRLEQSAARDSLTGLYDRVHFLDMLAEEFHRARRGGRPFSLLVLDLENFGEINRRFGPDVGDDVIRAVAQRLSHTVRSDDVVSRFGNDEFAVLMTDCGDEQAEELARRLSEAAVADPFGHRGKDSPRIQLAASFGVASYHQRCTSPAELLSQALTRLHEHRAARRAA